MYDQIWWEYGKGPQCTEEQALEEAADRGGEDAGGCSQMQHDDAISSDAELSCDEESGKRSLILSLHSM